MLSGDSTPVRPCEKDEGCDGLPKQKDLRRGNWRSQGCRAGTVLLYGPARRTKATTVYPSRRRSRDMSELIPAIKQRRSVYALGKNPKVSQEEIVRTIEEVFAYMPSAYNSQSARIVVLFGDQHDLLWEIVMSTLRQRVAPEKFGRTEAKIAGFQQAFGTVLFYDDTTITEGFAQKFPAYAQNFGPWAEQANGMLQFAIWTALEDMGLGANLQHYNPLIDQRVSEVYEIPATWKLIAQMPFGEKLEAAGEKSTVPVQERMRILYDRHPEQK